MTARRWLLGVLAVYPLSVLALFAVQLLLEPRGGLLGLSTILAPHLALAALLLTPLGALRDAHPLRLALAVLAVASLVRFGSEWLSLPTGPPDSADTMRALSWNLELGARAGAAAAEALEPLDVDVVVLQELGPDHAAAIAASAVLADGYPHRILEPREGVAGMGLLSRHPIADGAAFEDPFGIEARLELPGGRVTVINGHPFPARITTATPARVPVGFDPEARDAALMAIRDRVDRATTRGERVLLIGDFNVAPTEVAYRQLAAGLRDVHVDVGGGPGWTWRPARLEAFGIGVLRIDMAFTSPGLVPAASSVDCQLPGDHCRLYVTVAIE